MNINLKVATDIIRDLLAHLPDSIDPNDESWVWCWEELSYEAQERIKEKRGAAEMFLILYDNERQN